MSTSTVIPAKAGIQSVRLSQASKEALDPRLRGDDEVRERGDEVRERGDDEDWEVAP